MSAADTAQRRYPRFLPHIAVTVALVVMLTLTSTVGFAAWNATVTKNATVTAGTVGISSSGFAGLAHSYSATSVVKTAPVTVSNTGTVPMTLSSVAIAASSPLAPGITLSLWKAPTTACQTAVPAAGVFSTSLAAATSAIPASFGFAVPTTGLALCAATTLTGSISALAGQSVTTTITLTATVGTQWTAADASTTRTFAQSVQGVQAPTLVTCVEGDGYPLTFLYSYDSALIKWTAPVGGASSYKVYVATPDGVVLVGTTTGTQFEIDASNLRTTGRSLLVTVVAVGNALESVASAPVTITSSQALFSRHVNCG